MESKGIIKKYLHALESSDYENLISLFAPGAVVHSPLYGDVEVRSFYEEVFKDTIKSVISLRDIFVGEDNSKGAVNFLYEWILSDGSSVSFDCVDIFKFSLDGKIQELTIIYDASKTRSNFDKLKS
jgi:ketosteroid isomerase-like protein